MRIMIFFKDFVMKMEAEELAEIRHMLMSFRVAELQVLLECAGRSKSGRKHELMGRALQVLKGDNNHKVRHKIRELYRNRSGPRRGSSPHRPAPPPPTQQPSITNDHAFGLPVHPDVKLTPLPFFEKIDVLVKPTSLAQRGMNRFQEMFVVFHLSPHQVQLICKGKKMRPDSKIEYQVQVQVRFCLLETSCEQEDNYPPSVCLKVNGKVCPLPGYVPPNSTGDHKRPNRPINITQFCRFSPTVSNHICVTWTPNFGQSHVMTVSLGRNVTASCLITKLKNRGFRNPDHSRALIKEKLAHDPESEVATTSLRVSLLCPLGKTRMSLPCRSITCKHLQCFDAALYLQMNERKATWICPVCDQKADYVSLVLDGLYMEILKTAPDSNEIIFYEDGSWRAASDNQDESKKAIGSLLNNSVSRYSDSRSYSSQSLQKPGLPSLRSSTASSNQKPTPSHVIDLTLDSSDEEESDDDDLKNEQSDEDTDSECIQQEAAGTSQQSMVGNNLTSPYNHGPNSPLEPSSLTSALFASPLDYYQYGAPLPDLQGLDLYSLLHPDERYAMYMDPNLLLPTSPVSENSNSGIINLD